MVELKYKHGIPPNAALKCHTTIGYVFRFIRTIIGHFNYKRHKKIVDSSHANLNFDICMFWNRGPGSSVDMATDYGLDGPGIESRWEARFSTPVQTGPGAQPTSCTMDTGSFLGDKKRPGRDADPSSPSSAVGHERVELYLYSPYGPYGLYRASVPVQGCTLP